VTQHCGSTKEGGTLLFDFFLDFQCLGFVIPGNDTINKILKCHHLRMKRELINHMISPKSKLDKLRRLLLDMEWNVTSCFKARIGMQNLKMLGSIC
jgi:hypothetical protein